MMIKNKWLANILLTLLLTFSCAASMANTENDNYTFTQTGIASYFSDKFHGHRTASGELYDKFDLTAAHATLPFGSLIHVVNLQNNQSVDVRINSRSHHANRRLLDLSKQAAKELGFLQAGIAKVKLTVLRLGEA